MKKKILFIGVLFSFGVFAENTYYVSLDKIDPTVISVVSNVEVVPPAKTILLSEWLNTNDTCGGFRRSNSNQNMYYVRSKIGEYSEKGTLYQIPEGYRWISTQEYIDLNPNGFKNCGNSSNYSNCVYIMKCGELSYPYLNGETQRVFLFNDTYDTDRFAHSGAGDGELIFQSFISLYYNSGRKDLAGLVLVKE